MVCTIYYVNGRVIQKKVGKSKTMAKKVAGEIEAKLERKDANLEPRDYDLRIFFQEYLDCTQNNISHSYHRRNETIIKHFITDLVILDHVQWTDIACLGTIFTAIYLYLLLWHSICLCPIF